MVLLERRASPDRSLAVVALLGVAMFHAGQADPGRSPSLWSQVALEEGYFQYLPFPGNVTALAYEVDSNVTVATMVMDSAQFAAFNGTGGVAWLYGKNGTDVAQAVSLAPGQPDYLVFYAWSGPAFVNYTWQQYSFGDLPAPQPTGVASYGLYNDSGTLSTYSIASSSVVGTADIRSLVAYNQSAPAVNESVYGASLQLNAVLAVTQRDGSVDSYWLQDVPEFITNSSQLFYESNLWNDTTADGALTNQTITSQDGGYVSSTTVDGNQTDFYANSSPGYYAYRLPLDLAVVMNESMVEGTGVEVSFGVQVLQNGSSPASATNWFDEVTVHDPAAVGASFYVSGDVAPGSGNYYDTELVFGGEANGESTFFRAMNATLGVYYGNGTSALYPYPSVYAVGGDTLEGADNLRVSYTPGSLAEVSVGAPDYVFLGNPAGGTVLPDVTSTATASASSVVTSTTAEFPAQWLGPLLLATIAAVLVVGRVAERRRGRDYAYNAPEGPKPRSVLAEDEAPAREAHRRD